MKLNLNSQTGFTNFYFTFFTSDFITKYNTTNDFIDFCIALMRLNSIIYESTKENLKENSNDIKSFDKKINIRKGIYGIK